MWPAYEAWFKKYHLDLNDPKMLDADPDGDGFTNREEFLAGTDPLDPNSHPGVHTGMKMKEYTKVELPFMLRSVEGETAQIERTDGGEKRVETVKAGQPLKNSTFRVTKVQSKSAFDKDGHSDRRLARDAGGRLEPPEARPGEGPADAHFRLVRGAHFARWHADA